MLQLSNKKWIQLWFTFVGVIHFSKFDKFYHFSWLEVGLNTTFDWDSARNYCRRFCMDAIAFESFDEVIEFNSVIENGELQSESEIFICLTNKETKLRWLLCFQIKFRLFGPEAESVISRVVIAQIFNRVKQINSVWNAL